LITNLNGVKKNTNDEWIEFCPGDILLFLDLHPAVVISHREKIQFLRSKGVLFIT